MRRARNFLIFVLVVEALACAVNCVVIFPLRLGSILNIISLLFGLAAVRFTLTTINKMNRALEQ